MKYVHVGFGKSIPLHGTDTIHRQMDLRGKINTKKINSSTNIYWLTLIGLVFIYFSTRYILCLPLAAPFKIDTTYRRRLSIWFSLLLIIIILFLPSRIVLEVLLCPVLLLVCDDIGCCCYCCGSCTTTLAAAAWSIPDDKGSVAAVKIFNNSNMDPYRHC